jgi:acetyl esterase
MDAPSHSYSCLSPIARQVLNKRLHYTNHVVDLPIRVKNFSILTRDTQNIDGRLYIPTSNIDNLPILIYFHGGGFIYGDIESHDNLCKHLAFKTQCAVLSVEYRLAPEHKFPTAVNDAWDSVKWTIKNANMLGINPDVVAVGGDSAGGNLAAVCAILARDLGIALRLQLLIYPGVGGIQTTASRQTFAKGFRLDDVEISKMINHYTSNSEDYNNWKFTPLQHTDLTGVAPAWIGLAECDPLVDEGIAYAKKLQLFDVPTNLKIYNGMFHGFIQYDNMIPSAITAQYHASLALKQAFGLPL